MHCLCSNRLKYVVIDGDLGHGLLALVSKSASGSAIENQPGEVVKEDIEASMAAGISFVVRDWNETRSLEEDPRYHRPM